LCQPSFYIVPYIADGVVLTEGKATSRGRGKATFMPGLRKFMMHHRVDSHEVKPKDTKRDTAGDRETTATKSPGQ